MHIRNPELRERTLLTRVEVAVIGQVSGVLAVGIVEPVDVVHIYIGGRTFEEGAEHTRLLSITFRKIGIGYIAVNQLEHSLVGIHYFPDTL